MFRSHRLSAKAVGFLFKFIFDRPKNTVLIISRYLSER